MAPMDGFAEIGNEVIVLVNDAEKNSDINSQKAPQTLEIQEAAPKPKQGKDNGEKEVYWVKDAMMWRRKAMSIGVLTSMTVLWVVMEIYGYNFITLASWIAIFLFSSFFAWSNIYRLIYKEEPGMCSIGISDRTATAMANQIKEYSEDAMRWVFKCEVLGTLMSMSVPVIWLKYDYKIREHGKRLHLLSKRYYSMIEQRVLQKLKNKVKVNSPRKEKKVE
ncbi:hypothetical protein R6Q57_001128 [Mikania cordata]